MSGKRKEWYCLEKKNQSLPITDGKFFYIFTLCSKVEACQDYIKILEDSRN